MKEHKSKAGLSKREAELKLYIKERQTDMYLKRWVAFCLLSLFALNNIGALTVVFLVGLGRMNLTEQIVIAVILESIAQAAAMFLIVTKHHFSDHSDRSLISSHTTPMLRPNNSFNRTRN